MALTTYPKMHRAVLARLLDLAGSGGTLSPRRLMGGAGELSPEQLTELYTIGVLESPRASADALSARFRRVAEVLLDPHTNLTLRMWGLAQACAETNVQFPRNPVDGEGVLLNQLDGHYQIGAFLDDRNLLALLRPVMPPDVPPAVDYDFEAHLDAPVAAVLVGLLDLLRIASRVHADTGGVAFYAEDITGYLAGRWGVSDFYQLITYLPPTGLMAAPPTPYEVEVALTRLLATDMIEEVATNQYSLAPALQPLIRLTAQAEAGVQWQRVSLLANGELLAAHRIFVFGDGGFILGFSPAVVGRVHIARVTPDQYADFFVQELSTLLPVYPVKADGAGGKAEPSAQEAPTPVTAGPKFCTECGHVLKPGVRFCTQCGKAIGHAAPSLRACSQCGAHLKPGARFCIRCGAPSETH